MYQAPKRKQEESAYTNYRGCLIVKHSNTLYTTCRQTFSSMQEAMNMIDEGYRSVAEFKNRHKKIEVQQQQARS